MTAQLTFFDAPARARRTDPDTSHEAARHAAFLAQSHEGWIYRAISAAHRPLTKDEISAVTGIDHIAVARRIVGLREKGLVEDSGERGLTRTGRRAIRWGAR